MIVRVNVVLNSLTVVVGSEQLVVNSYRHRTNDLLTD